MSADSIPVGRAVADASAALRAAFTALVDSLDVDSGAHDDAAEVILHTRQLAALCSELAAAGEDRILAWLRRNRWGHRDVVVGEFRYFGERKKSERVRDMPAAFGAVARAELYGPIATAVGGDVEAIERLFEHLEQFAAGVVSAGGLKPGACRAVFRRVAEADVVSIGDREAAVERKARELFDQHWETVWPDRLSDQPAAKEKLGVGNLRFVLATASDAPSKARLEAQLARAEQRRREALERERTGEAWVAGEGEPAPGSWEGAVGGLDGEG